MKINGAYGVMPYRYTESAVGKYRADTTKTSGDVDKVEFSSYALFQQSLVESASDVGDMRTDRISAVKAMIDSGTYSVSASAVAAKIMQTLA